MSKRARRFFSVSPMYLLTAAERSSVNIPLPSASATPLAARCRWAARPPERTICPDAAALALPVPVGPRRFVRTASTALGTIPRLLRCMALVLGMSPPYAPPDHWYQDTHCANGHACALKNR